MLVSLNSGIDLITRRLPERPLSAIGKNKELASSVLDGAHCLTHLVVADTEVGQLQPGPAGLLLGDRQTLGGSHDLPNPSVAEQVRMHRRRLTCLTVA